MGAITVVDFEVGVVGVWFVVGRGAVPLGGGRSVGDSTCSGIRSVGIGTCLVLFGVLGLQNEVGGVATGLWKLRSLESRKVLSFRVVCCLWLAVVFGLREARV